MTKHKVEVVIERLYGQQLPEQIIQLFPTLSLECRSAFFAIYGCILDTDLSEEQASVLRTHTLIDEDILGSHHQAMP
jgi:hypothetical protein